MNEPTTEAGRELLAFAREDGLLLSGEIKPFILAIEAEARAEARVYGLSVNELRHVIDYHYLHHPHVAERRP